MVQQTEGSKFIPPKSYLFESELSLPVPRAVPHSVEEGSYYRKAHKSILRSFVVGSALLLIAELSFIKQLSYYIVPLEYLNWIGLTVVILAAVGLLLHKFQVGKYGLIKYGTAVPVQVLSVAKVPSININGQDTSYCFEVGVCFEHPESKMSEIRHLRSSDFLADVKDDYSIKIRQGDYCTGIYIDQRFESTFTLYGFTGLSPKSELVERKTSSSKTLLHYCLEAATILAIFACLLWNIYCLHFFDPLYQYYWPVGLPVGLLCFGISTLGVAWFVHNQKRAELRRAANNLDALASGGVIELGGAKKRTTEYALAGILSFGGALLLGLTVMANSIAVNALLDTSPEREVIVPVIKVEEQIHKMIFREVKLYFRSPAGRDESSITLTRKDRSRPVSREIRLKVRNGYFNWPWVSGFEYL